VRWELLAALVRKDLKVKYQGSVLGFAWSLANPILLMGIYYFVFAVVLKNGIPGFAIFIVAGLLPWTAFGAAVSTGAGCVVAAVLAITAAVRHVFSWSFLLIVPAIGLMVLFATAVCFLVSALNVRYRDTAHIVEIALLVWFWLNPVVYPAELVKVHLQGYFWVYFLNPMATVVTTFQRAVYVKDDYTNTVTGTAGHALAGPGYEFYFRNLAIGFLIAGLLLVFSRRLFRRMQVDFAEEL
jgi:ABC-2 type transport system permease protein